VRRFLPHGATAYLVNSETMSETVLAARRWCGDEHVLFGMPDTWTFQEDGGFTGCASLVTRGAFAVAGLWSVHESQQSGLGMVHTTTQATGRLVVTNITDKPKTKITTDKAWGTLAWSPAFWQYIDPTDPTVGLALVRALANQQPINATLNKLGYYDCGTPQRYYELCKMFASSPKGVGAL
jgi:UTP-glucose-1-phosphate uridylyltransferase